MIPPCAMRYTGCGSTQFASNPIMSSQSRDSIALYVIAFLAVMVTLYADLDLSRMFQALLARF